MTNGESFKLLISIMLLIHSEFSCHSDPDFDREGIPPKQRQILKQVQDDEYPSDIVLKLFH